MSERKARIMTTSTAGFTKGPWDMGAILRSATIYCDALAAIIRRNCDGKDIDGHRFTFAYKEWRGGVHTLTATDAFDGKRYTLTIEAERP